MRLVLDGLRPLFYDMNANNLFRSKFRYTYHNTVFDVFFLTDTSPFILMFGTVGKNIYFEIHVLKGFIIDSQMSNEDYKALCKALELTYDPNNPFKPSDFFMNFNGRIPSSISNTSPVSPQDLAEYISVSDCPDKLFFCGWYNNPIPNKPTPENLEKTKKLLSAKAFQRCLQYRISSKWTANPDDAIEYYFPD